MAQYTILLVDYDPRSIARTKAPLEEAGFRVEVSKDGLSAITAFEQLRPDLVLLEAMIPRKHGFEVCGELKKTPAGQNTPIIIITAVYKGRKYRMQAMHLHGADAYVERPVPDDQLIEICREHVRADTARPSTAAPAESKHTAASRPTAPGKDEKRSASPSRAAPPGPAGGGEKEPVPSQEEEEILAHLDAILSAEASGEDQEEDPVPGAAAG